MENLAGETLRCRLLRDAPLSIPQAAAIAIRIAEALHYAHGRGIIHRDVKPDNVFLADNPDDLAGTPKLMDFGIARVLSDQSQTQDGTIVGSPAYMSPEQINGLALDGRTDVFSLAVMLTEMVTGAKPFEAETIPAVMQKILRHAPNLRGVADRPLRRVLAKALAKNPKRRPRDAAAFADALRLAVPQAALAPSIVTQVIAEAAPKPLLRPWRLPSPLTLGLGSLALATLALLPILPARHTPPAFSVFACRTERGSHGFASRSPTRRGRILPLLSAPPPGRFVRSFIIHRFRRISPVPKRVWRLFLPRRPPRRKRPRRLPSRFSRFRQPPHNAPLSVSPGCSRS